MGPAVAVPPPAGRRAWRWRGGTCGCSAARGAPGDRAHLRLRRRARRHRALRPPARVQRRPSSEFGLPGPVERGGVRREAADRRRQGADGHPVRRPGVRRGGRRPGRRAGARRAARPLAPGQDGDVHEAGRRRPDPARPGHRPGHPGRAGRRLDGRGRLDLGRGVGARRPRARGRRGRRPAGSRSSPATSCRPRSRTRRSTGSPSSELGLDPADTLVVEDSRNGLLAADRRRAAAAWSRSTATPGTRTSTRRCSWSPSSATPAGRRSRSSPTAAPARPGDYVTLDDLRRLPAARRRRAGRDLTKEAAVMTEARSSRSTSSCARSRETAVENEKYFGDLDSVVGDGDFGYSLARGFEKVLEGWDDIDRTRHRHVPEEDRHDRSPRGSAARPGRSGAPRSCGPA